MPHSSDFKSLLLALLLSLALHLAIVVPGRPDSGRSGPRAAAPAEQILTARLLAPPAPRGEAIPPRPEPAPAAPTPNPLHHQTPGGETTAPPLPATLGLTRRAHPLGPVDLDIPEARLPTVHGSLILKLWINEQGQVVAFEPEPTELPAEYVLAIGETLTAVRFAPALQQGQPVASILRIEINADAQDDPP